MIQIIRKNAGITSIKGACMSKKQKYEKIDHPDHYQAKGMEAIDVIEAYNLNFSLGSALKYILRAGKKPGELSAEDLKKAIWYLEREINRQS
tara:strand:+ start:2016 stop:2291 length:276 start_codon:yes stop_codon:yes gene_type:complete